MTVSCLLYEQWTNPIGVKRPRREFSNEICRKAPHPIVPAGISSVVKQSGAVVLRIVSHQSESLKHSELARWGGLLVGQYGQKRRQPCVNATQDLHRSARGNA